jgi:hypothetical protein
LSMPIIPNEPYRPTAEEAIIDLLKSVAMEETALAHLMNAEAEQIQAFVGKNLNFPSSPSTREIIGFNVTVSSFVETLVMQEWLLLRKLDKILQSAQIQQNNEE